MDTDFAENPTCYLIGQGSMLIRCGEMLLAAGFSVLGVITEEVETQAWAIKHRISHRPYSPELVNELTRQTFDYLFSIVNFHILPEAIIRAARKLCINYHDGPLPRYSGRLAPSWALLNNEISYEVCWHVMDPKVDAGDLLVVNSFELDFAETSFTLNAKCYFAGLDAFAELIKQLLDGTYSRTPQAKTKREFFLAERQPAECGLLDFNSSATKLERYCRAFYFGSYGHPWGYPKLLLGNREGQLDALLLTVIPGMSAEQSGQAGSVVSVTQQAVTIAAAEGAITIEELTDWQGHRITIPEIQERFELASGVFLPLLDEALQQKINALQSLLIPHEAFWVTQLELPPCAPKALVRSWQPLEKVRLTFHSASELSDQYVWSTEVTTRFALFIKHNCQGQALGFVPASIQDMLGELSFLFATVLPLSLVDLPDQFAQAQNVVDARLDELDKHLTYHRDLALSAAANAPQRSVSYPIRIKYGSDDNKPCGDEPQLCLVVDAERRQLTLHYHPQLTATIQALQQTFEGKVTDLSQAEPINRQSLSILQGRRASYPRTTIYDLFKQQAQRKPEAIALEFIDLVLSYEQLFQRVEQLASGLWVQGARPGTIVGLHVERGVELIVAVLAILRTGAAYLPLDTTYPTERLDFMVKDAQVALLVCNTERPAWLHSDIEVVNMQVFTTVNEVSPTLDWPADCPANSDDLVYIIYTSGSTGKPKGVQIKHSAVINFFYSMAKQPGFDQGDVLLAVTSISFDIAVLEIFLPLTFGGRLVLADAATVADGDKLADLLMRSNATVMQATPASWEMLLAAGWSGKERLKMLCGGEAMPRELAAQLLTKGGSLWNMYGPTETTIWSMIYQVDDTTQAIPIGRPIANTSVYILDPELQPVAHGQIGELYIGGDGLSLGYLNRPELTAERFVEFRFDDQLSAKLYRTGDLAAINNQGYLTYHGRIDHQVKVRGYRIELEEIEAILESLSTIGKAVAAVKNLQGAPDNHENKILVAYIQQASQSDQLRARDLRQYLRAKLPDYIIPAAFVPITTFPLTPNGKIDRQALPVPNRQNSLLDTEYAAPTTQIEQRLVEHWKELLGLENVGVDENFFEIGGNSLLVGHLVQTLSVQVGQRLNPVVVFANPTIRSLATTLKAAHLEEDLKGKTVSETASVNAQSADAGSISMSQVQQWQPAEVSQIQATRIDKSAVAIVGMACRFPGAANNNEFFDNISLGIDSINPISAERRYWQCDDRVDYPVDWQGSLDEVTAFDYEFFGISAREARRMDPLQRLFLEIAYTTVENAGYCPEQLAKQSCGVYVGLIANEYPYLLSGSDSYFDAHTATGNALSLVANRVSYLFNWQGPSLVVDTACSSSLVCLDIALRALRAGQIDAALVGGVNVVLLPDNTIRFYKGGMLSANGRCFSFSNQANGYVRGEGVGAVLIKPLSQALADGDHIWSVIRGSAVNHDGRNKVGLTAPNPNSQAELLRQAYQDAGCSPATLGYLEAHGTGTALGDPIEVQALTQFIRSETQQSAFCALGSVKSNIGHLEPAAGIAGIIKAALCLKHRVLPPTLHVKEPNQHINFETTPFYVNDRCRPWPETAHPRRSGVSSFGYGGTNAHAVLEEPPLPVRQVEGIPQNACFLLPISARSKSALRHLVSEYLTYLQAIDSVEQLVSIFFTACLGRQHFSHRLVVVAHQLEQFIDKLQLFYNTDLSFEELACSHIYQGTVDLNNHNHFDESAGAWLAVLPPQVQGRLRECFANSSLETQLGAEDIAETHWCESDRQTFYVATARLYALGFDPQWEIFCRGTAAHRVPLPTYPFAHHHCWVDLTEARIAQGLHPIVKAEKAHLAGACYELDLNPAHWLLDEHRIQADAVLPGAALLDSVLSIAQQQLGTAAMRLRRIQFIKPLVASEAQQKRWYLLLQRDKQQLQAIVYAQAVNGEANATETPYFRASLETIEYSEDSPDTSLNLEVLQQNCIDTIDVKSVYQGFERAGLYYASRFRCLKSVKANAKQTLGLLEIEADIAAGYLMHPALMDGALQTALSSVMARRNGALYVPFVIEALEYFAPLPRLICVYAELIPASENQANLQADVTLTDTQGRILARLLGVTWRRTNSDGNVWQDLTNCLRLPSWVDAGLPANDPLRKGRWLVFVAKDALTDVICEQLRQADCEPLLVEPGSSLTRLEKNRITLCPKQANDYHRLLDIAMTDGTPLVGILHLWSVHKQPDIRPEASETALDLGLRSAFYLFKALAAAHERQPLMIRFITVDAVALDAEDAGNANPWGAALSALIKVAAQEQPHLNCASLDLASADLHGNAKVITQVAAAIMTELAEQQEPELALRPSSAITRLKPELLPLAGQRSLVSRLRTGGVYLITGGLGGIGCQLATWLITHYQARIVLLSRTAVVALPEPLRSLQRVGHSIESYAVDVANESLMAQTFARVEAKLGAVNGIFHAAGVLADGLLINQSETQLESVLHPKVHAMVSLDRFIRTKNLDFTLLFSSISGVTGNIGQSTYAAANRFLDVYALRCRVEGLPVYSIDWGLWKDTGMGQGFTETAHNRGIAVLTSDQAFAVIEEVLRRTNAQTVVVDSISSQHAELPEMSPIQSVVQINDYRRATSPATLGTGATNNIQTRPAVQPDTSTVTQTAKALKATAKEALTIVADVLAKILERPHQEIEIDTPFLEMGVDSMLAVSAVSALEEHTGLKLPPTLFFDYPTANKLATALVQRYALNKAGNKDIHTETLTKPVSPDASQPTQQAELTSYKLLRAAAASRVTESAANIERQQRHDIAIIGMAGRFPGASDLDVYWALLTAGRNAITEVPLERWNAAHYFKPESNEVGSIYNKWGGFLDKPYDFDPLFFRISPLEAEWLDPQQRILLETAWHALENAGYSGNLQGSATGVFVAASYSHYRDQNVSDAIQTPAGLGNLNAILANRLSYFLDLNGPSLTVDTLCSSSLVALNIAAQNLRAGVCEQALVAGVHVDMSPRYYQMACRLRAFSPTGRCHSFDRLADGFIPGEGCGVVVLKPLAAALADGDYIHGVIRGSAVNHGGQGNGLTVPRSSAQAELIRAALADANLSAESISYIEAHGTGTALGDPIEIAGLSEAFSRDTARKQYCAIGTVKTNIGHLEPAAGMAGLIKVLLCLRAKQLPPSLLSSHEINPAITFEATPFYLNDKLQTWHGIDGIRRAGISSFGMGGTNGHVIVEQAPEVAVRPITSRQQDRSAQLFVLSARSQTALRNLVTRHANAVKQGWPAGTDLGDVCHTLASGRAHFNHRLVLVATEPNQIETQLNEVLNTIDNPQTKLPSTVVLNTLNEQQHKPSIAFLFTGQGSQLFQMGRSLYETEPVFRRHFTECKELLEQQLPHSLLDVLYGDTQYQDLIHQTGYAQPALFTLEYALAQLFISWGIKPDAVIGHSVGEYVAACIAGVFDLEDAVSLIAKRAQLMQSLPAEQGSMLAIRASRAELEPLLENYPGLALAADNGPNNQVVSGDKAALQQLLVEIGERYSLIPLAVSHAFHSPLLNPIAEQFNEFANDIHYSKPELPVISNLTGSPIENAPDGRYWTQHMLQTVQFAKSVSSMHALGIEILLEIGPQATLINMVRQMPGWESALLLPSLEREKDDWQALLISLAHLYTRGFAIDWQAFNAAYTHRRVPLPVYPFEHRTYRAAQDEMPTEKSTSKIQVDHLDHPLLDQRRVVNWE